MSSYDFVHSPVNDILKFSFYKRIRGTLALCLTILNTQFITCSEAKEMTISTLISSHLVFSFTIACIHSWCSYKRIAMLSSTAKQDAGLGCPSHSLAVILPTTTPPVTCALLLQGKCRGIYTTDLFMLSFFF